MNECFGRKFILDGVIQNADHFSNNMVYEGDSIYEVIRMVKGNPVFFFDHMKRLEASLRMQKRAVLADAAVLRRDIIRLSKSEKRKELNLKIVFNYAKDQKHYLVYFIEPIYPSVEQYKKGVKGILFHAERKDPESKIINHKLRSSIYHKLILEGGYEALLVNEKNQITEGSRSNIFFLRNDILYTAPGEMVLNGITRKHILDICSENRIKVKFECVTADSMGDYDAVFMTGTSPAVLKFHSVNDTYFNTDVPVADLLRQLYLVKAEESIRLFLRSK